MNKEEYYLNQDMTSECIQLPNQFQQGDCLIQQNYLSELSNNPEKVLHNLGLDTIINALQNCCSNTNTRIDEIINNYNDFKVVDGHSRNMNQLLTKGIYRNCNLGRPYNSETGEQYTCIVLPIKEEFKVCDGIRLQTYEDGTIGNFNIGNIQLQEFYSNNKVKVTNTYLGSIFSARAATILLSVAPSRTFGDNRLYYNIQPTLSLGNSGEKLILSQSVNYNRDKNSISIADLKTFEVQVEAGNTPIKISDNSRDFNWWVFDVRPACGYTPILQVCISQNSGMMYYRMLYTKDSTKFEFPNTLYNDWKGSDYISRKIEELNITVDSITEDIGSIQENITEIQNQQGVNIKFLPENKSIQEIKPEELTQEDDDWRNTVYLELCDHGDHLKKYYASYNAYKIKVIDHSGGATQFKWIQISQSLIPNNDFVSLFQLGEYYESNEDLKIGDSYDTAFGKLVGKINNLSHESSGECDCPDLPIWVTEDKPDFGEKNIIETIELNGSSLPIINKTVNINIQETITSASDGLKIDGATVKHTNSINNTLPDTEVLCKIKFDQFGHITSYSEITPQELFNMLQSILDENYAPNSDRTPVNSVTIIPGDDLTLTDKNPTRQLSATTDGTNKNITWISDNPEIATVNSSGKVTGVASGTTKITAKLINSSLETGIISDTINVTVQFSTVYYFSIGTEPVTEDNYTKVNNPITSIPTTKEYTNSGTRAYVYILAPSNKTVSVREKVLGGIVTVSEIVNISGHKVYKTGAAVAKDGTIIVTLN